MRTLRRLLLPLLLLTSVRFAEAQAIRFDSIASTTSAQCVSGKQCPLNVLPGTRVNICQGTVTTLATCLASPATTYTGAAAGTPCATTSQLTPSTGGACLATADNQGGYGFWILPGTYNYFLRVPTTAGGGTYGPYPISVHGDSGGYTDATLYATLALGCSAAGSGTLAVSTSWNATSTQALNCNLTFFGGGKITMASSAVLTVNGTITAPPGQQIFNTAASGSSVVLSRKSAGLVYPQWWGALEDGVTDDTAPMNASFVVSRTSGITNSLQPGTFAVNTATAGVLLNILVPGSCNWQSATTPCGITIRGAGHGLTYIKTTTASADVMAAISIASSAPQYKLSGFTLVCPDASNHSTTNSGNGLRISGSAVADVEIDDVYSRQCFGSGKAGIWIDTAEGGSLTHLRSDLSDIGFKFTGAANVMSADNLQSSQPWSKGFDFEGSTGQGSWKNLIVQGAHCTGFYSLNAAINAWAIYLENNNAASNAGCHGLYLDQGTRNGVFEAITTATATDDVFLDGVVGNKTSGNRLTSNKGTSNPAAVTLNNAYATGNDWYWQASVFTGAGNTGLETGTFLGCRNTLVTTGTTITGSNVCNRYVALYAAPTTITTLPDAPTDRDGAQLWFSSLNANITFGNGGNIFLPGAVATLAAAQRTQYLFVSGGDHWNLVGYTP